MDPSVNDDVSSSYMQHAQAQASDATIERFRQRMEQRIRPDEPAATTNADAIAATEVRPRSPLRITIRPKGVMDYVGSAVGDVAKGVFVESPGAIAGGMNDAARNAVGGAGRAIDSVAEWLNENVADLKIPVPKTGDETLDRIISNPALAAAEAMPEKLPEQKTVTGGIIREGARFLTGFLPAVRAMKAAGVTGTVSSSTGGGLIADFVTQDPGAPNLSALIESVPALKNPVTQFLKADPEDNEALNRLKQAVDGAGFGLMAEGVFRGIRAAAQGKKAKTELELQIQKHGEALDKDVFRLGDPNGERVVFRARQTETGAPATPTTRAVDNAIDEELKKPLEKLPSGFDTLERVRFETEQAELRKSLQPAKLTRSEYVVSRTEGMGPKETLESDSLWAMAQYLRTDLQERMGFGVPFSRAFERIANIVFQKKFGRDITAEELTDQMIAGSRHGLLLDKEDAKFGISLGHRQSGPRGEAKVLTDAQLVAAIKATETGVPDSVAAHGVAGAKGAAREAGEPEVFVNFSRINASEDVQAVIKDMANAFKGEIDTARRGVQSNDQTKALADNLGMTVEDLLARRKGQPLNAEEALAARRLWAASAEKLQESAMRAADPNAGPIDQFNFRRMMAIHHAIQSEVIAARTETARALQSWAIPAGGGVERAKQIASMIDSMGGPEVSSEMAKRIAMLGAAGVDPGALAAAVRRGWVATSLDMVKESFVLGLLWSPTTHIVNSASNMAIAFQSVYERAIANKVGDFLGSSVDARVVDGEALAMAYGMVTSLKDAFSIGWKALKTGEGGAATGSKIDIPPTPAISSETIARERGLGAAEAADFAESAMGRFIDFTGAVTRAPGRVLTSQDEFFKSITYRAEVHAQSLRQATQEGNSGPDLFRRMAELANDPPEHIRLAAADAALYNTFQRKPGDWAQGLLQLRNSGSLNPTFMVLPFIKTPANILSYTFERTPLAPLVGQWRDDIAAGGARRDLALARMASGTAIMAVGMDLASSGQITGPGPSDAGQREALMRTGWRPNSILIGDKYYSFSRADPFGMVLGFAGAIAEKMKASDMAPEDFDAWEEVVAAGIAAISASVVDKTYFEGVARTLSMIQGSERGEGGVARFIDQQTGSLLPMTSAHGAMKRFTDPVTREVNSPWEAIQAKIAGLSDNLPPARDLWGKEREPQGVYGRVYDAVSPIAVSKRIDSPVDAEMTRLQLGIQRIKKKATFQNVEVNFRDHAQVYDEYVRLAGNELKHPAWNMGAKDMLDAVVSGRHSLSSVYEIYSDGPEGGKASFIRNIVSEYRKLAQEQIMKDRDKWPDFAAMIDLGTKNRQELKMPAGAGPTLNVRPQ